jgi:hypothetical protein
MRTFCCYLRIITFNFHLSRLLFNTTIFFYDDSKSKCNFVWTNEQLICLITITKSNHFIRLMPVICSHKKLVYYTFCNNIRCLLPSLKIAHLLIHWYFSLLLPSESLLQPPVNQLEYCTLFEHVKLQFCTIIFIKLENSNKFYVIIYYYLLV